MSRFDRGHALAALVLPRRKDILYKGQNVWFGFIVAAALVGFQPAQLHVLNALCHGNWMTIAAVPLWAKLALGMAYFLVSECLLQQAKLLWDDLRDYHTGRDRALPQNRDRALARGLLTPGPFAYAQVVVRTALAFGGGWWLGGLPLVTLFAAVLLHQLVYSLWAKPVAAHRHPHPRRARHRSRPRSWHTGGYAPLAPLLVLAPNVALRFLIGAMAVVGGGIVIAPLVILFVAFCTLSVGVMATQWRIEVQHRRVTAGRRQYRPQGTYFWFHGLPWQRAGLGTATLLAAILTLLELLATTASRTALPLYGWYGQQEGTTEHLRYPPLTAPATALGVLAVLLSAALGFVVVHRVTPDRPEQGASLRRDAAILAVANVCVLTCLVLLVLAYTLPTTRGVLTLTGFTLLFGGLCVLYDRVTLREYSLDHVLKHLPAVPLIWRHASAGAHTLPAIARALGITLAFAVATATARLPGLVRAGDQAAVCQLLALDPSLVTACDARGWTALHIAAARGDVAMMQLLVRHGAPTASLNDTGQTPATIAVAVGAADASVVLDAAVHGGDRAQPGG